MASPGSVNHLNYDENLAESAPAATKAQIQSGYNPDLLKDRPTPMSSRQDLTAPPTSSTPTPPSRPGDPPRDVEKQSPPPKKPFYKTTTGILIILLAAAIVIGAVVGGAVGGTRHHNSNNNVITGSGGQGQGASGGEGQGQGAGAGQTATGQGGAPAGATANASGVSGQSTVGASSTDGAQPSAVANFPISLNPGDLFPPSQGADPNLSPSPTPDAGGPTVVEAQNIGFAAGVKRR